MIMKNNKGVRYSHFKLALSFDTITRFKVLAAGRRLTMSEMIEIIINDYWDRHADKTIPLPGTSSKIRKTINKVFFKAAE